MEKNIAAFNDKLGNSGISPGYRSAEINLTICTSESDPKQTEKIEILLDKNDSWDLLIHLLNVHKTAWGYGDPIDIEEGEKIPPLITKALNR